MGPWHHGQEIDDGSSLGALKFGSDTGLYFRAEHSAAISRSLFEGRRAEGRCRAGVSALKPGRTHGAVCSVAGGLRERLRAEADAALSRCRT